TLRFFVIAERILVMQLYGKSNARVHRAFRRYDINQTLVMRRGNAVPGPRGRHEDPRLTGRKFQESFDRGVRAPRLPRPIHEIRAPAHLDRVGSLPQFDQTPAAALSV